jgi:hypothetical protein
VEAGIQEINRRFGPRTLWQQLVDAPILVRYFLRSIFHNSVSSLSFVIRLRLLVIMCMLYDYPDTLYIFYFLLLLLSSLFIYSFI